jgi:hypothetical protein
LVTGAIPAALAQLAFTQQAAPAHLARFAPAHALALRRAHPALGKAIRLAAARGTLHVGHTNVRGAIAAIAAESTCRAQPRARGAGPAEAGALGQRIFANTGPAAQNERNTDAANQQLKAVPREHTAILREQVQRLVDIF